MLCGGSFLAREADDRFESGAAEDEVDGAEDGEGSDVDEDEDEDEHEDAELYEDEDDGVGSDTRSTITGTCGGTG